LALRAVHADMPEQDEPFALYITVHADPLHPEHTAVKILVQLVDLDCGGVLVKEAAGEFHTREEWASWEEEQFMQIWAYGNELATIRNGSGAAATACSADA